MESNFSMSTPLENSLWVDAFDVQVHILTVKLVEIGCEEVHTGSAQREGIQVHGSGFEKLGPKIVQFMYCY